jgi:AcrR family transcriptional regulator
MFNKEVMGMVRKQTGKEALLLATIACIEKKGIHAVTVRDIAKEADVNVAAVNYYFGSKEKLFEETLVMTSQNALVDWKEIIEREYATAHELFTDLFLYSIEGVIRYPNITRAHLHDAVIGDNYRGFFIRKFNAFLVSLVDKAASIESDKNREYIELSIVQMFTAAIFACLAPGLYRGLKNFDIRSDTGRVRFIEHLVSAYWG